jgi:multidrug resistance efflux pump
MLKWIGTVGKETPRTASDTVPAFGGARRHLLRWALPGLLLALLAGLALWRGWFVLGADGSLTALGTLEATEVTVSSEVTARIREILVAEGDTVHGGQVLIRLDDALLQQQYRQVGPGEQQLLDVQLSRYSVNAPLAGIVLRRSAEPGETAVAGAPLLTIADLAHLDVTVYVLQRDLGRVYPGQEVLLAAEALSDLKIVGQVKSVAARAEYTPRNAQTPKDRLNLVFAVKVRAYNDDKRLRPGMSVVARFAE